MRMEFTQAVGKLHTTIISGSQLKDKNWFDTLDPYCVISLGEGKQKKKFKTRTHKDKGTHLGLNKPEPAELERKHAHCPPFQTLTRISRPRHRTVLESVVHV